MIRTIAFVLCLCGFVWICVANLKFRQSIRTKLQETYIAMERVSPGSSDGPSKVLNSYYESVYEQLPPTLVLASMLMVGATVLVVMRNQKTS